MKFAVPLHVLAVMIWIGGMFFAHMVLRPVAVARLQPPARLPFMQAVLNKFFPWVWICVLSILLSGLWIIFKIYGGFASLAIHVHIMVGLGIVMMLVFFGIYLASFIFRFTLFPGSGS